MLFIILGAFAVVIVILLIIAALRPNTFRIERSLSIAASPATLFPHINDLKKAQVWSPWIELDPAANYTFGTPSDGSGATMAWAGNNKAGEGAQTIVESRPNERVRVRVDFKKPFASTSMADFTLKPEGSRTVVSWAMSGQNKFMFKFMCLFMNQDKMIGGHFEKGLMSLKTLVESGAGK